jgi:hypothetical protein
MRVSLAVKSSNVEDGLEMPCGMQGSFPSCGDKP